MNFKPYLLAKVLDGSKTQTRRIRKPREFSDYSDEDGSIIAVYSTEVASDRGDRLKWRVGNTYAVAPGRGKAGVARIKILGIQSTCALIISDDAAIAEGFADRESFLEAWDTINGKDKRKVPCWAITFELVKPPIVWTLDNGSQLEFPSGSLGEFVNAVDRKIASDRNIESKRMTQLIHEIEDQVLKSLAVPPEYFEGKP